MNPTTGLTADDRDNTAASAPGRAAAQAAEPTDAGATVVRAAPSAATVGDISSANNFGKYELLGEIARGGMGVVYRARQRGLDRTVALKMILGTGISHETAQRFTQEAHAAAALDHPNVVPIYDIGEIGDRPYFTMALVDGPNLRGHVEAMGTVPIPVAVALFAQIVAGVAHAHQAGIIHRDLKPANVLIDRDGRPRVTDFGLAKRATTDTHLTATGQVVGTPSYMAPEQARDSKDVGPPADVYALGAILYFLLTGRPPFQGESFTDLLIRVVSDPPVPPGQLRADVPADLEALCLRCLAKTPGERFADADALGAALAPIADRHLSASAGLTPSLARLGLSRPSTPTVPSVPDLIPTTNSGPVLVSAPSVRVAVGSPARATVPSLPELETSPARGRGPVFVGLAVVAVVLLGAVGYLATRGDKKDEVAKQGRPPAIVPPVIGPPGLPPVPPPGLPVPPPVVPPPVVPPGKAKDADKLAWPPVGRADFELKVELVAVNAKKSADGTIRLVTGNPMEIRLTAARDCRVSVWVLDPAGGETRLFPNAYETDDRLVAGQTRVLPGNNGGTFEPFPTEGLTPERLRVLATTGEPITFPPGAKKEQFTAYATDSQREQLASTVRGVLLKKPAGAGGGEPEAVAEAELRFFVK